MGVEVEAICSKVEAKLTLGRPKADGAPKGGGGSAAAFQGGQALFMCICKCRFEQNNLVEKIRPKKCYHGDRDK